MSVPSLRSSAAVSRACASSLRTASASTTPVGAAATLLAGGRLQKRAVQRQWSARRAVGSLSTSNDTQQRVGSCSLPLFEIGVCVVLTGVDRSCSPPTCNRPIRSCTTSSRRLVNTPGIRRRGIDADDGGDRKKSGKSSSSTSFRPRTSPPRPCSTL